MLVLEKEPLPEAGRLKKVPDLLKLGSTDNPTACIVNDCGCRLGVV
jgi:hypothetical protein